MSRRRLSVPLPPTWLVFHVFVIAALAAAAWADHEYWHWYSADPAKLAALESEQAQVSASIDNIRDDASQAKTDADSAFTQLAGITGNSASISRVAQLAAIAYALSLGKSQNMSSSATEALYERCYEWATKGGDFEKACR